MKKIYLHYLMMCGKYSIYSFVAVILLFNSLLANSGEAQSVLSVKEVFIDFQVDHISLKDAFSRIEENTDYKIFYRRSDLKNASPISMDLKQASVEEVLIEISRQASIGFKQVNNTISVNSKINKGERVVDVEIEALIPVSGRVTDENGQGLPGATVVVKGGSNGTTTDLDGNFKLNAPEDGTLVISYVGYLSVEVEVGNRSEIDVQMKADVEQLTEVVVTAFGIEKDKKSVTYATQDVDTDKLSQARTLNVLNGLSGRIAGMSVTTTGGGVGAGSKILLRGNRSINGSSEPLYVVDGVIMNSDISNLSPDDIKDISVLKGANAAALYGSRANNGAIIITTKSGSDMASGVSTSFGITYQANDPVLLTKYQNEYGQGAAGIYGRSAVTSWGPQMTGQMVDHWTNDPNHQYYGETYPLTAQPNNVDDFFQVGHSLATNLSVGVNKEDFSTYFGYTHTDASGVVEGNDLTSHNLSIRTKANLTDKLELDTRLSYINRDFSNVLASGENYRNPVRFAYMLPRNIRTEDIEQFKYIDGSGSLRQHFYAVNYNGAGNPYWTANHVLNPSTTERVTGLVSLKYNITDHLSIMGRSALDKTNNSQEQKLYNDTYTIAVNGLYSIRNSQAYDWNTDFLINYNQMITSDISFDLNVGGNLRVSKRESVFTEGENFSFPNLFSIPNTTNPIVANGYSEKEVQSLYAAGQLSYLNAIFFDATVRNDWSSTLPKDNRSYLYPSVGLTMVLTDLINFPQQFTFVKLRGSWAEVGNDTEPYSLQRDVILFDGTMRLDEVLPNKNLRPETTQSTELGVDFRLFKNRVKLDLTYYKSNSFDQIFETPVPLASGAESVFQNGADIQNKGVEIMFGVTPVSTPNFKWNFDINFAKNNSEVLEILEGFESLSLDRDFIREYKLVKGEPFGAVYSRGFLRDDDGNVIVDAAGIPMITPGLDVQVSNFNPDFLAGIMNSFSYKGFNMSFLVDIRQGGTVTSFTDAILAGNGLLDYTVQGRDGSLVFGENIFSEETAVTESGEANNISISAEDLWNKLGGRNAPVGEAFVRDASNIRLRELIFGYSLPESLLSKLPISSGRISFVGRNLFFIHNKSDLDPELVDGRGNSAEGRSSFGLPTNRSFGLSLKFDF